MNRYLDGMMGLVIGDALGVPYEFKSRSMLKEDPCTTMRGQGTYNLPAGFFSDDSSMALACLDALKGGYDLYKIMDCFIDWYQKGKYTPDGFVFDIGNTTANALEHYMINHDVNHCGENYESSNGNGALMRILPLCLYLIDEDINQAITKIHEVAALTHAHKRSLIACGIYYFIVRNINDDCSLEECIDQGIKQAFDYYKDEEELKTYHRLLNIKDYKEDEIHSYGYVVASLEASLWCLLNTTTYDEAVLKAVNLGSDTDTTAAICGGLAGLYYHYDSINKEWLNQLKRREYIEEMCKGM